MDTAQAQSRTKTKIRKPKLAPIRIVNTHHLRYIQEKEREKQREKLLQANPGAQGLAVDRPTSVPGHILLTEKAREVNDDQPISRPSTRNTVKDGIILRWDSDDKPLLRRPRTSTKAFDRASAKLNKSKARMGIFMNKAKAKGIVSSITQAAIDSKNEKTAAELNLEVFFDPYNPYKRNKEQMIRQYQLWNGDHSKIIELPPLQDSLEPQNVKDVYYRQQVPQKLQMVKHRMVMQSMPQLSPSKSCHVYNTANLYTGNLTRPFAGATSQVPTDAMQDLLIAMSGLL